MLTRREYEDLWKTHFTGVGIRVVDNPNNCPTDYCDYLIREYMFEDYLDIFRGINSRGHRKIKLCEEGNNEPHPFFNEKGELINSDGNKLTKQTLKYVMIGEAAPSSGETYFYNINHLDSTSWLIAPVKAFSLPYKKPINEDEKRDLLLELAKEGYLLIDLFPFSLKFTSNIRKKLNSKGASDFFYKRLQTKIDDILKDLKMEANDNIKVAFSGPPTVHHYLAKNIFDTTNPLSMTLGMYNIENVIAPPKHFVLKKSSFHNEIENSGLLNSIYLMGSLTKSPIFRSCCYDGTNQNPHELFIRNAFDLP